MGEQARALASDQVAERIGGRPQRRAGPRLQVITGPERAAILVGPAGTGKGVVIDAAARAEQYGGHQTLGIAVSGSTAQRLGQDSPALAGRTLTLDALVSRVERGQLHVDKDTTIYFDEAGMADTDRLDRLTEARGAHRLKARRDRRRRAAALDRRGRHVRPARATSPRAPSCRTCAAPSTRTNSGRGQTCAPDAQTARWPTTTPAGDCTWRTPAMRPSSRPSQNWAAAHRDPSTQARSR